MSGPHRWHGSATAAWAGCPSEHTSNRRAISSTVARRPSVPQSSRQRTPVRRAVVTVAGAVGAVNRPVKQPGVVERAVSSHAPVGHEVGSSGRAVSGNGHTVRDCSALAGSHARGSVTWLRVTSVNRTQRVGVVTAEGSEASWPVL